MLSQSQIPPFDSVKISQQKFRFRFNNGIAISSNFTTLSCLNLYCMAIGGGATLPRPLFNNMRLKYIKLWQPCAQPGEGAVPEVDILLEFNVSTTAGFGGAPRITHTASCGTTAKYAYLHCVPSKDELASQWFSGQQASYTLWNMSVGTDCIMEICFDVVYNNGDSTPAGTVTSTVGTGTLGVTNFANNTGTSPAGCRSIGLENLINP